MAKTLLEMSGADLTPNAVSDSVLILIDCQNEYVSGALPLVGIDQAMENARVLLELFRAAGSPVIHIQHEGKPGGAFDLSDPRGAIDARVAPVDGETVIRKGLPNSFADTALQETLVGIGRQKLVIAGFQTHMCVSATTRAALDLGYRNTLVADAIATRDLPSALGEGVVSADTVHAATLAALSDRFAIIAGTANDLPD
ncbi:cysteine hydrolase family protein [Thalassospiraceae bacterium LMO-JJ14]|nr:cysteine hydrolase family protein [Thalassospiraceae bacterium LMO-JJ14]